VRQEISLQQGIPIEKAREIVKKIRTCKLRVQASIQAISCAVASRDRDNPPAGHQAAPRDDFGIEHAVNQLPQTLGKRGQTHLNKCVCPLFGARC